MKTIEKFKPEQIISQQDNSNFRGLEKTPKEQRLFNQYKQYIENANAIDSTVLLAYSNQIRLLNAPTKDQNLQKMYSGKYHQQQ